MKGVSTRLEGRGTLERRNRFYEGWILIEQLILPPILAARRSPLEKSTFKSMI